MGRLLGFLFLIIIIVISVGFLRGWFTVSTTREDANHRVDVNMSIDSEKLREDATAAQREAGEFTTDAASGLEKLGKRMDPREPETAPPAIDP